MDEGSETTVGRWSHWRPPTSSRPLKAVLAFLISETSGFASRSSAFASPWTKKPDCILPAEFGLVRSSSSCWKIGCAWSISGASQPAIAAEVVNQPIIVTGLGRSGTTLLHELLAQDPANRAPLLWEFTHTVPAPTLANDVTDPRAEQSDREITMMDEMVPSFKAMHENGGHLPTECIFAFAHQFSSDMFTGLYNVASYTIWRSGIDQGPAYQWHAKMLQTMQWGAPTQQWVLKAPSHLSSLPLVFSTYPDARVVITHRDPLRVVGSLADMLATLHWMHSDHVDHEVLVEFLSMGLELQMNEVTKERDSGLLPTNQISDVLYRDLVRDPVATVEQLYDGWGMEITTQYRERLETLRGGPARRPRSRPRLPLCRYRP